MISRLRIYTKVAFGAWTLTAALLLLWHDQSHNREMNLLAQAEARASWRKDILYRSWAARHGGVYVPPTEKTPPNPYLAGVADRDVVTASGKRLTLINPAYMTREVSEIGKEKFGIITHITSLRPLNPANAPDLWERAALAAFEKGEMEVSAVASLEGRPRMRLIRPLFTEEGCLGCHAAQGYKVGDIRGGLSVAIPMEPFFAFRKSVLLQDVLAIGLLWIGGCALILVGGRRAEGYVARIEERETETRESEERFRVLVENAGDTFFLHDLEGRFIDVNRRACETLGYSREELLSMQATDVEVGLPRDVLIDLWSRSRPGEFATADGVERRKDGTTFPVEARVGAIERGGEKQIIVLARDVTERKRAEEALKESERRYRSLYNSTPTMLHSIDREGRLVSVSDYWLEHMGYSREEVIGRKSVEFLTEESARYARDVILPEFMREGICKEVAYRMVKKNGEIIDVLLSATSEKDADGRVIRSMAAIEDVTERNRSREALERSNAGLVLAQRIARLGSWEWDVVNDTATRSEETFRLFGADPGGSERSRRYFLGSVHPEDRERVQRALVDALDGSKEYDIEYRIVLPDTAERIIHARAEVIRDDGGRPVLMRGTVHDITAGKRIEDALQFVAQSGWAVSGDEFFPALARYMGETFGVDYVFVDQLGEGDQTAETVALYARGEIVPNLRYDLRGTPCENVMGKKLCCYPSGVQRLFPNDAVLAEMRAESYVGIPLWDSSGKPIGLIAVMDSRPMNNAETVADVMQVVATRAAAELERKRAYLEKEKLQAQLQQSMKMEAVGRLAGGVAHDFNNLLTAIIGNVSLAQGKIPPSDPVADVLQEANKAAERAAALTQQLLAFSRKQIIEPKVLNLNDLIADLNVMLVRLIREDIMIQILPGEDLGSVHIDAGQFQQVLVNLVVNARDAMPGGGKIVIETSNAELDAGYCSRHPYVRPGRFVMVAVSDTGYGMTGEVKARIFEPFFTTKANGRGTGLGLATAYGAVKQAGGSIEVYSEAGMGTTFKIYLPRVEGEASKLVRDDRPRKLRGGTETVLLVEDEDMVRDLCVRVLDELGYRVLQASNGKEALAVSKGHGGRIDLLMTDVVMPGMNGGELAAQLILHHPGMRVLFTSGYTEDVIVHHGVLDGEVSFLGKPYSPSTLAAKIREVLGKAG
jgi:PAS domain S-box-containing protein